jgi:hypothetical protein
MIKTDITLRPATAPGKSVVAIETVTKHRFNPMEGRSTQDIICWFENVLDVELNQQNYSLAQNAISFYLSGNPEPTLKSVLDYLEGVDALKPFALELKKNLLFSG